MSRPKRSDNKDLHITRRARSLYRQAVGMRDRNVDEHSPEWRWVWWALRRELKLAPWQPDLFDVPPDAEWVPRPTDDPSWRGRFEHVRELHRRLVEGAYS
jgi:hypothetical protein